MSSIRQLFWILSISCAAAGQSAAQPKWTSLEDFSRKVDAASAQVPGPQERALRSGDSVAIVFVPGILGSELKRNDKTIWGDGSPTAADLALPEGGNDPAVQPRVLGQFALFWGLKREDVYEEYLDALERARGGRGSAVEFPYDWRLDIRENANRFDKFLRSDPRLVGRTIIIVAHSMGGVIAWHWQSKYFDRAVAGNPAVRKILFVGAPLKGTCEMVRMLVSGYKDVPAAGWLTNVAYGKLFRDLRPAAFTFPSVFQLLPRVPVDPADTSNSCLDVPAEHADDRLAADYFDVQFWQSPFGRFLLESGGAPWKTLTSGDQNLFFTRLRPVLKAAGDFRAEFNLDVLKIPSILFYSDQHETVTKVKSTMSGGRYAIDFPFTDGGDGRVAQRSAYNENFGGGPPPQKWRLDLTHGELPKDSRFVQYLVKDLARTIRAEVALAYAKLLLDDPAIFDAYFKAGGREIAGTAITADLDPTYRAEVGPIVEAVNAMVAARTGAAAPSYNQVRAAQQAVPEGNAPANRALIPQLELALQESPPETKPFAQGRLGFAHFYGGDYGAAVPQLRAANEATKSLPADVRATAEVKQFIASVTGLLGAALARSGRCEQAAPYLEEGRKLGNQTAKAEFANACVEKSTGKSMSFTQ
jgi:pimeloyl-ACP methyl ester carboxylesterase